MQWKTVYNDILRAARDELQRRMVGDPRLATRLRVINPGPQTKADADRPRYTEERHGRSGRVSPCRGFDPSGRGDAPSMRIIRPSVRDHAVS